MDKQYSSKKNPYYDFANLKTEDDYKCDGTQCTCKYLHNRTSYDANQFIQYQRENDIDYGKNMFISFKNKK